MWLPLLGLSAVQKQEELMGRWLRAAALSAVVVATALVGVATTAAAGTMQVSGSGVYNEACTVPADAGAPPADTGNYPPIKMDGSLEGCWYTYVSDSRSHPSGAYQESGTELFVGCLNETTCGTFSTTYTFTGKFTANFEAEIHGRCQHPIVSGTGDFAGTSGIILFKDDVDDGVFYYRGNMKDSDGASHNHETDWEARTRKTSDR